PLSAGALYGGVTVSVFETLKAAFGDLTYLFAATARPRGMEKPVMGAAEAAQHLAQADRRAGIVFGAENHGLPSDVVAICDVILTYPVNPDFASLNLAQAVAVFCGAWGEQRGAIGRWQGEKQGVGALADKADLMRMFEHFEDELDRAGYFYPPDKTPLMKTNLRNAFVRGEWTEQEVRTFRGAIKALALGRGHARIQRKP
ncbi:MAG: TrmH family RNA methyltransferase, partial [Pseudomonadota bacterium]